MEEGFFEARDLLEKADKWRLLPGDALAPRFRPLKRLA